MMLDSAKGYLNEAERRDPAPVPVLPTCALCGAVGSQQSYLRKASRSKVDM